MVKREYVPDAGDIVWVDFDPARGHEQKKHRPALVVSPKIYNKQTNLALMCPITSIVKGYPFEVKVDTLKTKGVILVDHIKSLDWHARKIKFISAVDTKTLTLVRSKLLLLIKG